jgi:hypothetical protein
MIEPRFAKDLNESEESSPSGEGEGGRRRRRGKSSDALPGRPRLIALRTRKAVEGAAMRVCNLLLSGTITAQDAHALLHGLRLILDSMKLTEGIEAEYRLREVAEEMRAMRETNQVLYQRLVDLGVAPAN